VDENNLLKRIENRVAEMTARREPLRADDNAESLKRRLRAYRDQTEPLLAYYAMQGALRSVDGMAPIPAVAAAIDRVLSQGARRMAPQAAALAPRASKSAGKPSDAPKKSSRMVTAGRKTQAGKPGRVKSIKKAASGRAARGKPAAKKVARPAKQPSRKAGRQRRLTKKR
jgi:adenylate kinase